MFSEDEGRTDKKEREEGETSSLHVKFLKNIFFFDSFDEVLEEQRFFFV